MRTILAAIPAMLLATPAPAEILSLCLTNANDLANNRCSGWGSCPWTAEVLPDAQAERRQPCPSIDNRDVRIPLAAIMPTLREQRAGLTAQEATVSTVEFRHALAYRDSRVLIAETPILFLSVRCGENSLMGPGSEAMVEFDLQTLWGPGIDSGEAESAAPNANRGATGPGPVFLWADDSAPEGGEPGGSSFRLLMDDHSGDDALAVMSIPATVISNGIESIALQGGTVTLNGPEADCVVSGTVEVVR